MLSKPIILVKILGAADGYWNPLPMENVACLQCLISASSSSYSPIKPLPVEQDPTEIIDGNTDRVIKVANFRNNIPVVGQYYLAFYVNEGYVLDNQATFLEYQ